MPIAQVTTVISTGKHLTNSYGQLNALRQEKHSLLNNIQTLQHEKNSNTTNEAISNIQANIVSVDRQINDLQLKTAGQNEESPQLLSGVDRVDISSQARALYHSVN
ncbi:hypothetical protein E4665_09075 [Sporolactobacillus shoreae]|uniref:Uncharacterized protein n=1 Tax=Sporolactobacillus shoreae TaxID=1465501 RepID=A0A4Z0GQ26_9BACL|nr:hypothetical protein [Sporolactobacillus shoreae]TGA98097.1 hypothetical protein E4665_09075 [Sporolactobacillus shoreae]